MRIVLLAVPCLVAACAKDPILAFHDEFRGFVKQHWSLSPIDLQPADVALAKGRKVLFAKDGRPDPVWIGDYEWPREIARRPGEVGVIVLVTESELGRGKYTNGATARDSAFTASAILLPEKKLVARWTRHEYAPFIAYLRRGDQSEQRAWYGNDEELADARALFAGKLPDGAMAGEEFSQAEEEEPSTAAVEALTVKAQVALRAGDFARAEPLLAEAAVQYEYLEKPEARGSTLELLATAQRGQGNHAEAARSFGLAIAELGLDLPRERLGLLRLARANELTASQDDGAAADEYVQARMWLEDFKDHRAELAKAIAGEANARARLGELDAAEKLYAEALPIFEDEWQGKTLADFYEGYADLLDRRRKTARASELRGKIAKLAVR